VRAVQCNQHSRHVCTYRERAHIKHLHVTTNLGVEAAGGPERGRALFDVDEIHVDNCSAFAVEVFEEIVHAIPPL